MNSTELTPQTPDRFPGLDILRVLAMALITVQHGLAAVGRSEWVQFGGMDAGQVGVGVFCAVSGLLAMNDRRAPTGWLWRRLQRLFPPYWIAMLFSFAVTAWAGRKSFDVYQFISQMLGLGYFTHGWFLVNQVTWFISLILLCYVLAFAVKFFRRPCAGIALLSLISLVVVLKGIEVDLSQHILSFCLAGTAVCLPGKYRRWMLLASSIVLFALVPHSRFVSFAAVSLLLTGLFYTAAWGQHVFFRMAGGGLYEYFLVHGIFFVGAGKFISSPVLVVVCGLAGSIVGAVVLRKTTNLAVRAWCKAAGGKRDARSEERRVGSGV